MGRKKKEQAVIKINGEDCADRLGHGECTQDDLFRLKRQISMGIITYGAAAAKHFFRYKKLRPRVDQAVKKYKGPWRNVGHMLRMQTARKMTLCFSEKDTPRYFAIMYLLTSSFDLFSRILGCFSEDGLQLNLARLRGITPYNDTLFRAAWEIYNENEQKLLADLASRDKVSDAAFRLILTALMVSEYGHAVFDLIP